MRPTDFILVKLTDQGRAALESNMQHALHEMAELKVHEESLKTIRAAFALQMEEDEDGYTRWQLWEFMAAIGDNAADAFIELTIEEELSERLDSEDAARTREQLEDTIHTLATKQMAEQGMLTDSKFYEIGAAIRALKYAAGICSEASLVDFLLGSGSSEASKGGCP